MKALLASLIVSVAVSTTQAKSVVVYTSLEKTYSETGDANSEIYLLDLSNKKSGRITRHEAMDYEPAIHPNKQLIAFVTDRFKYDIFGDAQIILKDLRSGREEHLNTGIGFWHKRPRFSADGEFLYFSRAKALPSEGAMGRYRATRYNLKTKTFETLFNEIPGNFFDVTPSADGKSLAYSYAADGDQHVRIMNLETGISQPLNPNRDGEEQAPSWRSPTSISIVTKYGEHEWLQKSLFDVSTDGMSATQVFQSPLIYDYSSVCWLTPHHGILAATNSSTFTIELFEIKGAKITQLTSNDTVSWSDQPDCR